MKPPYRRRKKGLLPSSFFRLPSSFFLLPSSFFLLPSSFFLNENRHLERQLNPHPHRTRH
jgi:hypothetical protein